MRNRRRFLGDIQSFLNLDSLVDIVSNNVGILVVLAVFMAIFSLMDKRENEPTIEQPSENIKKLKIPWSHASQKNSLLLLLQREKILFLDRSLVYQSLKKYLSGRNPLPEQISLDEFSVKLTAGGGHSHCLDFLPKPGVGQWWYQASKRDGLIQNLTQKNPREENHFFFWVDSDSFELFREIRRSLWKEGFEVGWKPVREGTPLRYCSGDDQRLLFQPQ
ncbi:MAG: hypothetical protein H8E38_02160 [SAR324 cluster bacterium]|nr:hypothetical protein [SAR324 cluster bacterium]MBL7034902.1 hypothetical protein [SAR324 cluster bacterium]